MHLLESHWQWKNLRFYLYFLKQVSGLHKEKLEKVIHRAQKSDTKDPKEKYVCVWSYIYIWYIFYSFDSFYLLFVVIGMPSHSTCPWCMTAPWRQIWHCAAARAVLQWSKEMVLLLKWKLGRIYPEKPVLGTWQPQSYSIQEVLRETDFCCMVLDSLLRSGYHWARLGWKLNCSEQKDPHHGFHFEVLSFLNQWRLCGNTQIATLNIVVSSTGFKKMVSVVKV